MTDAPVLHDSVRRGASPVDGDSGLGDGTCPCPVQTDRLDGRTKGMGWAALGKRDPPSGRFRPGWVCVCVNAQGRGRGQSSRERNGGVSRSLARAQRQSGEKTREEDPVQEKGSTPLGEPTGAVRDGCEAGLSVGSFLEGDDSCPPGWKEQLGARDCEERR